MDWKFKIGDVISTGGKNRIVVTGTREDQCPGGVQRFYGIYHIIDSFSAGLGSTSQSIWIPDIVLEEIEKIAQGPPVDKNIL